MKDLKEYFIDQLYKHKNEYNIFSVLHREADETRLHSRFIAFLLDPTGSHNHGDRFLNLFFEFVLETDYKNNSYKIEKEFQFIDILIYNDQNAVIIENKIYAGDSNHKDANEGNSGQLERYYNTIITGKNKKGENTNLKRNVVQVAYLTLEGYMPTKESIGITPKNLIKTISYRDHIRRWLDHCAKFVENENPKLKADILQYRDLTIKLTSEIMQAKNNQIKISQNIDLAIPLEITYQFFSKEIEPVFNHVKWHTIDDFFCELAESLSTLEGCEIKEKPSPEQITKIAHNKGKSQQKLKLKFRLKEQLFQIVNDTKGFTLGNLSKDNDWKHFPKPIDIIKFNNFSNEDTFRMIKLDYRKKIIESIITNLRKLDTSENPFKEIM